MSYLVIEPKDKKEQALVREILLRMNIPVFTEEEEDASFVKAMKQVDFSKRVPIEKVKAFLKE